MLQMVTSGKNILQALQQMHPTITQNNNFWKRFSSYLFYFNRETKSFLALHWCGGALVLIPENSLLMGWDMPYVANVGVGRPICFM
jgi:fumarate reductase subunit C